MTESDRRVGCLWGTALGDALGLCREGLSQQRGARLYPHLESYQLFGGRGWVSDDTEHAAFTAWALQQPEQFDKRMRHALRRWLWTLPAGIGLATLRAGLKASLGLARCGVYSAGNGPLMRAPIIALGEDGAWEQQLQVSTELTHTDPRAHQGARMIALTTRYLVGRLAWAQISEGLSDSFLLQMLAQMGEFPEQTPQEFAAAQGWQRGVSGFVYHTAPLVVQAALRHRDNFGLAVRSVIECGGDTDTTAAIVGGMVGGRLGPSALPTDLLQSYADRPLTLDYLEKLGRGEVSRLPAYPLCVARNLLFGWAILGYGLRRLLPPY